MQTDDELTRFAAQGAPPLLPTSGQGLSNMTGRASGMPPMARRRR